MGELDISQENMQIANKYMQTFNTTNRRNANENHNGAPPTPVRMAVTETENNK